MTTSKIIFLFILHVAATTYAQPSCPETRCPGSDIPIRFPFGQKDGGDKRCRYNPSFDLSCNGKNQVTITLPAGEFTVSTLDYELGHIWVNDPGSCLSRRLLSTNFTVDPPFEFPYLIAPEKYSFLNCSPSVTTMPYVRDEVAPVACLSGENYTVAAVLTDSYPLVMEARPPCSLVSEALVPGRDFRDPVFEGEDVFLKWDLPACLLCELKGETCGFVGDTGDDIGCSVKHQPTPHKGKSTWVILAVVGIVVVVFACGFMFCSACKAGPQLTAQQHSISLGLNHNATTTDNNGLDMSTIESYPKTVLLELREPNHNTCSICLSEYKLGETMRTIPSCQHYFHVNLRLEYSVMVLMLGGNCGFVDDTGDDVGCSIDPADQPLPNQPQFPKGNRRWLIESAGVPGAALVCLFLIWCTCKARPRQNQQQSISLGVSHLHHTTTTTTDINNDGLDRSTIESYPKTVLLELRDPNNNTCSICLSEYKLGETIRTIPSCQHYFHVNCIDRWLRKSQTCPLCRNIPHADRSSSVNPSLPSMVQP